MHQFSFVAKGIKTHERRRGMDYALDQALRQGQFFLIHDEIDYFSILAASELCPEIDQCHQIPLENDGYRNQRHFVYLSTS